MTEPQVPVTAQSTAAPVAPAPPYAATQPVDRPQGMMAQLQHAINQAIPPSQTMVAQQPGPVPQMSLDAGGMERDANGERDWKHGLFGCFGDIGTCCVACWCPCFTYAENKSRLEYLERSGGAPHPEGGEMINVDTVIFGGVHCLTGFGWLFQWAGRGNVRRRYKIRGSAGQDCFATCCCLPCSLTQDSLEIEAEERISRPTIAPPTMKT